MAVYKATYCYPFLNTFDPRIVATKTNKSPAQYLKCKVDTSNKTITGYQIVIRDNENNIVFPVGNQNNWKISPIQELEQNLDLNGYTNSGINGSYLNIAFLQNSYANTIGTTIVNSRKYKSYNSVYFKGAYQAQYIISTETSTSDPAGDVNNWSYDSSSDTLTFNTATSPAWDGTLNGELLLEGNIVFVRTEAGFKLGLWYVYSPTVLKRYRDYDGNVIDQTVLANVSNSPLIFITQGKAPRENNQHYYYYRYGSSVEGNWIRFLNQDSTNKLWVDINDNMINFTDQGGSYKWEIILYQGEGTIYQVGSDSDTAISPGTQLDPSNHLYYISYDNMSYEYYDMTLTNGQILGSTLTRFQLANKPTAQLVDDDGNIVGLLPGENSSTPLVLLNKYAQLLDNNNNAAFANRIVVDGFDSSYGHVYFKEGAVTEQTFKDTTKVEFYKYSNVIDDIKEGDLVDVATASNVEIGSSYQITKNMFTEGKIDGVTITQGMKVLIKNATDTRFNGVYIAETGTTQQGELQVDIPWSRAGSYDTWGSFIGKIICVRQGTQNRGKNFQSQAKAGGTLLIPDGTAQPGVGSELGFNVEQPIVLFDTIPGTNIYSADLFTTGSFTNLGNTVDGYNLITGMKVVAQDSGTYKIKTKTDSGWTEVTTLTNTDYIKIALGQTYGNKVVKYGSITSDLSSSYVLKNTDSYTFVSPFIGMSKDNALFFYNKNLIIYNNNTTSYWLKINSLYEKFWLINHNQLSVALASINPFKYELRSYFKQSDENPFFTYENPYLKIQPNSSFTIASIDGLFYINTVGRYITLQGLYFQPQQASWETYRWVLQDQEGNIVQDTGKRYDKKLLTTFYGLSNEDNKNIYFATLYVDDNLNNSLSLTIKIVVNTQKEELGIPFKAEYDCNTQSVMLFYDDIAFVKPSVEGNQYVEVYVSENKDNIESYTSADWDNSNNYDVSNNLNITGINGTTGAEWGNNDLVSPPSNLSLHTKDVSGDIETTNNQSQTVKTGVEYKHFFSQTGLQIGKDENMLKLYSSSLPSGKDEFTFKTDLVLDKNYCGQILRLEMDGTSASNKIIFTLAIPDNFTDANNRIWNYKNWARNLIKFDILTDSGTGEQSKFQTNQYLLQKNPREESAQSFATFSIPSGGCYYYLQFKDQTLLTNNQEYLHFASLDGGVKPKIYFMTSGGYSIPIGVNNKYSSNCLIDTNVDDVLNYWVEYENHTTYNTTNSSIKMLNDNTGVVSTGTPTWPNSSNEEEFLYWCEDSSGYDSSIQGEETNLANSAYTDAYSKYGYVELESCKRHPNWDNNHYKLEIIAKDIAALYNGSSFTVEAADTTTDGYHITNVKQSDNILLTIKIKPILGLE